MSVMKTFCGCLSTRSGTTTVLLVYTLLYIVGIVSLSLNLDSSSPNNWFTTNLLNKEKYDCAQGPHKDAWWCVATTDIKKEMKTTFIVCISIQAVFLVSAVLALFGASRGSHWLMLPWIIFKFILLALLSLLFVLIVILMSVYKPEEQDSSEVIAAGVVSAALMAFLFYLWLCVVSHFQILREISRLGLNNMENVRPFKNEDDDDDLKDDDDDDENTLEQDLEHNKAYDDDSMEYVPKDIEKGSMGDVGEVAD